MNIFFSTFEHEGKEKEVWSVGTKPNGDFPKMKDLSDLSEFIKNKENKEALIASIKGE